MNQFHSDVHTHQLIYDTDDCIFRPILTVEVKDAKSIGQVAKADHCLLLCGWCALAQFVPLNLV